MAVMQKKKKKKKKTFRGTERKYERERLKISKYNAHLKAPVNEI